ncbi:ecotin family protein [Parapedobacter tibetensis]|uniref:ecotin family protein n=1 Tax=Parapedobacter tibetensis TaxID=2972951 RepID=UPI00214DEFF4|nr:ecotin family protein [Parapedobacter tibetensis]
MAKSILTVLLFGIGMMAGSQAMAQDHVKASLEMFPKPAEGQKQIIIEVPLSDNDHNKKIAFYVGKDTETDACNHHSLMGSFEKKDLQGWGYDYYVFHTEGHIAGTKMACPDDQKITQFVRSNSEFTNYNGRLPIVIYVPEGYDVKFEIWRSDAETYRGMEIK